MDGSPIFLYHFFQVWFFIVLTDKMVRNAHDDDADDFMPDRRDVVHADKRVPKKVLVTRRVFLIKHACHDNFHFLWMLASSCFQMCRCS